MSRRVGDVGRRTYWIHEAARLDCSSRSCGVVGVVGSIVEREKSRGRGEEMEMEKEMDCRLFRGDIN